jgi:hypothetical protein
MTFVPFAADVPSFVLPTRGLLIEGQRTNSVRNSRAEGAIAGAPGTLPTNWGQTGGGLSREIIGVGTENGIPYIDLRIFGTSTNTFYTFTAEGSSAHTSAASGQAWTASIFARLLSGTVRTTRFHFRQIEGGGADLGDVTATLSVFTAGSLADCRMTGTATLTAPTVARVFAFVQPIFTTGTVIDDTWRIGFPQLELGSFASTPILPPVGAPAAALRGTDILTAPLSSLGIADSGACTVLWRGVVNVLSGTQQTIVALDDNTSANRCDVRLNGAGIPEIIRVTGGVANNAGIGAAAVTPNTTIRAGLTLDGAGRLAAVFPGFAGGAVQFVTGAPTSGLTTFRHGISQGIARELWGETHTLIVLPPMSDAEMQAAVAAL